ncbi:hypothetical protein F5Y17DRAFT_356702 [Xylariaceae sp. FL0594]|nr:hypothetical protein F5Y17DRAFT_356702 [Xylariaceae sp. FL0594]
MHLQALITALIGAVSVAASAVSTGTGTQTVSSPVITNAPDVFPNPKAQKATATSCSTECWVSYAECHSTLTYVTLCFTPPPCGTLTVPAPYDCPPTPAPTSPTTSSSINLSTLVTGESPVITPTGNAAAPTTFATSATKARAH